MTTYVVGDIQGCLDALRCVLDKAGFRYDTDQLWCAGDLVNRGPDSLGTLRFLYQMRDQVTVVLGNHDLHLLAVAAGARTAGRNDTFAEILAAPDCDALLHWLRHQPLLHRANGYTLVHAGLLPSWSLTHAQQLAQEVEAVLRSDAASTFFAAMYGNEPARWSEDLQGMARLRCITNVMTRMRFCEADGTLDLRSKGPTPDPDSKATPWFEHWPALPEGETLLFGHWAALQGESGRSDIIALDTGCVWGGALRLLRLPSHDAVDCRCSAA